MPRTSRRRSVPPVLRRTNYQLLGAGAAAVFLGFVLMYVEGALNGVLSLYVAPLLIMGGYAEIVYALLWRPQDSEKTGMSASSATSQEATPQKRN